MGEYQSEARKVAGHAKDEQQSSIGPSTSRRLLHQTELERAHRAQRLIHVIPPVAKAR